MKSHSRLHLILLFLVCVAVRVAAEEEAPTPAARFGRALQQWLAVIEPAEGTPPKTFSSRVEVLKAEGLPKELMGRSASLAFQAPDRLTLAAEYKGNSYSLGRNG